MKHSVAPERTGPDSTLIAANGFWGGRFERAVRIFNPSNRQQSLPATYKKHEREKIRAYEQRVREVEHGSFTLFVMSASGGCGSAAIRGLRLCLQKMSYIIEKTNLDASSHSP